METLTLTSEDQMMDMLAAELELATSLTPEEAEVLQPGRFEACQEVVETAERLHAEWWYVLGLYYEAAKSSQSKTMADGFEALKSVMWDEYYNYAKTHNLL